MKINKRESEEIMNYEISEAKKIKGRPFLKDSLIKKAEQDHKIRIENPGRQPGDFDGH